MKHISTEYDLSDPVFLKRCRNTLDAEGALVLPDFLTAKTIEQIRLEGQNSIDQAYFCITNHNVYLTPSDKKYSPQHPRNAEVVSSKGLIGDDQISDSSPLKQVYRSNLFQSFIRHVVGEEGIYPYADPLSSVNLHFAKEGQELGWHFDNSSFAITLLIEKPDSGGVFEYVKNARNADAGDMSFSLVGEILEGKVQPETLEMNPGTLVLFRGRNSLHRVTPTEGKRTRMLAVLAYNSEPNISLSENARQIFYGRLG